MASRSETPDAAPRGRSAGPSRRELLPAALAVLVAIGLVAFVLVTGGFGSPSSGSGSPDGTLSSAESLAGPYLTGGEWKLLFAEGVAPTNSTLLPVNDTSVPGCTLETLHGTVPGTLSLPAFSGNLSGGTASAWLLEYQNASATGFLVVVTTGASVELAAIVSGTVCAASEGALLPLPGDVVDSSAAAAAVAADGGFAYLAAQSNRISLSMTLGSFDVNGTLTGPVWTFAYSPCTLSLTGGLGGPTSGTEFTAVVNATTGAVLLATPSSVSCASSGSGSLPGVELPTPT